MGFQAEHTLGRRIVERRPTLRVFGEDVELKAQVAVLNGYSAHADRTELRDWLRAVRSSGVSNGRGQPRVHLVHGEPEAQEAFSQALRAEGFAVDAPAPGEKRQLRV